MTFRAVKAIQECEVVFCEDTRVTKKLFDLLTQRYAADISKKTFYSLHSHNEERILQNIDISILTKNASTQAMRECRVLATPERCLRFMLKKKRLFGFKISFLRVFAA